MRDDEALALQEEIEKLRKHVIDLGADWVRLDQENRDLRRLCRRFMDQYAHTEGPSGGVTT
tara:strand:+ start:584 stop:766 length:183 start_codon:yes stop_codon:yes gene_type:complete